MAKCTCDSNLDGHLPHKCSEDAVEGGNLCQSCIGKAKERWDDKISGLSQQVEPPPDHPAPKRDVDL